MKFLQCGTSFFVVLAVLGDQLAAGRESECRSEGRQLASLKRINTLFVFAPPDAPLGSFMPAVRLVRDTVPNVHVFVE